MEIWKQIDEYPNYNISSFGNVINNKTSKYLKPSVRGGYYVVGLYVNKNIKTFTIHRLVTIAFIPNPEKKLTVNHKDHNKLNNNITNLEWATMNEQNKHRRKPSKEQNELMGSRPRPIWRVDVNTDEKIEMYETIKEAILWSKKHNLTLSGYSIHLVLRGNQKTAYGFKWKYDTSNDIICDNEEWKKIPKQYIDDNEGFEISNMGRLKYTNGIITIGSINIYGYLRVTVKNKSYLLHRLVSQTFLLNPENKPIVNHKDGNKANSKLENLEWMTASENTIHAYDSGFCSNTRPIIQYDKQMNKIQTFKSIKEASRKLKIDNSDISKCCNNKAKSCRNFVFRYFDDNTEYNPYTTVRKPVIQYDLYMNEIAIFASLQEASKILNINKTSIRNCCNNKAKNTHKFIFKFC